jgi:hypothetical protein
MTGMDYIQAWRLLFRDPLISHSPSLTLLCSSSSHDKTIVQSTSLSTPTWKHTYTPTHIYIPISSTHSNQLDTYTHKHTHTHTKSPCATTLPLLLVLLLVTLLLHPLADNALVTSDGTLLLALGSVLVAVSTTPSLIIVERKIDWR